MLLLYRFVPSGVSSPGLKRNTPSCAKTAPDTDITPSLPILTAPRPGTRIDLPLLSRIGSPLVVISVPSLARSQSIPCESLAGRCLDTEEPVALYCYIQGTFSVNERSLSEINLVPTEHSIVINCSAYLRVRRIRAHHGTSEILSLSSKAIRICVRQIAGCGV